MEKWTDQVVLPAFRKIGVSAGILSSDFNVIRMTAEAEREETLNVNAPDTPLVTTLTKRGGATAEDLDALWRLIAETANNNAFWGFKDLFLVAVCRHPVKSSQAMPIEDAWRLVANFWDSAIDMRFVPVESVRAHASVMITAQVSIGPSVRVSNGDSAGVYAHTSSFNPADSSRKRKAQAEDDFGKRVRVDHDQSPQMPGMILLYRVVSHLFSLTITRPVQQHYAYS